MNWDEVTKHLTAPLDPRAIKPPPQGKYGEYVDALHVIREANRIFGHNGWSYEVTRLDQTSYDVFDLQGNNGTYQQLRCSFLCSVKVNVDGVIREGTAVGIGNGKPTNPGDVIESAVKEAETDALKRAMRTFGNTFGLALYEKDRNAREVGYTASQAEVDAAIDGVASCSSMEELGSYWQGLNKNAKHVAAHKDVIAEKDAKKAELAGRE